MNLQTPSTQRTGTEGQALYGHRSSPPRRLIQPNGEYAAGWFNHFSGELNFKDSRARQRRLQRWFHLQFETETHFIVANIAHLGLAGDTTILVMHKETGDIKKASKTSWLWSNPVAVDAKCSSFFNGKSDSSIVQRDNGEVIFSIQVEGIALRGRAVHDFAPPFIQCTSWGEGLGMLQWWGHLTLEEGELTVNGRDVALPYGSRGGYDRTAGHRPRHQNWNWLASTGTATTHEGQEVRFAVQFAKDQALATPTVAAQKYTVWVDSHLVKVHEASFTRSQNPTSPGKDVWTICGHGPGPISEIELRVQTRFHRREHRRVPGFVHVDFNQYYGPLTGTFRFGCQSYVVQEAFSVIEDSLLVL